MEKKVTPGAAPTTAATPAAGVAAGATVEGAKKTEVAGVTFFHCETCGVKANSTQQWEQVNFFINLEC